MRKISNNKINMDGGYTLLFAMIVASIVLALGVSLLTVSRKEFILSSSATQSSDAFYAADSGIGCAEYWDNNNNNEFATSSVPSQIYCSNSTNGTVGNPLTVFKCSSSDSSCSDLSLKSLPSAPTGASGVIGNVYQFTFYVPYLTDGVSNNYSCAAVSVEKYFAQDKALGAYHTYTDITSAGYNLGYNTSRLTEANPGVPDCSSISPKKVNRTIELTY
ncbi:MAG: hypothetical protein P4L61_00445 [Candidatus Pacebacteria bacterium]|nr:hypothetical protein [Candidatus Paceibacterota bacterium]